MNITTGTGGQAWRPERLTVEAYAPGDLTTPAETLGAEVITAEVTYGPLGAVRGLTLGLASVPQAWRADPYSRLLRLRLKSEHGEGYVAAGVLQQVIETPGALAQATVIGVHDVYAGAPCGEGYPYNLRWPGLVDNHRLLGVLEPSGPMHMTREAYLSQMLEAYPNSEWGVGADMVGVVGVPEGGTPAEYTVDDRALDLRPLGHTITNYVTHWSLDAGDGWRKFWGGRADLGLLVPRRTGQAQGSTYPTFEGLPVAWEQPIGVWTWQGDYRGDSEPLEWRGTVQIAPDNDVRRVRRVTARVGVDIASATVRQYEDNGQMVDSVSGVARIYLDVIAATGWRSSSTIIPTRGMVGVYWVPVDLPADALHGTVTLVVSIGGGQRPDRIQGTTLGGDVVVEYERPSETPLTYPEGYTAPPTVGPTHEFRLRGWHVPPLRVLALPGGLNQYVAGAVVRWVDEEATTKFLTAALPYPGQRRR